MRILGIDFGLRKIGLAIAEGKLAEPLSVIKFDRSDEVIKQIQDVVETEKIDKVVVGISEGQMQLETEEFTAALSKTLDIPVETFDETLSTRDAQTLSRQAGIKRKKRRQMEDAFAAAVMLQLYLDGNV